MSESISTSKMGHEVGTAGRRARRDLRMLAVAVLLSIAIVAMATLFGRDAIGGSSDTARMAVAADLLAEVQELDTEVAFLYYAWIAEHDLVGPAASTLVADATTLGAASADAWKRYKAAAVGLPGEGELIAEHDGMIASATSELNALLEEENILAWDASPEDLQARLTLISATAAASNDRLAHIGQMRSLYRAAMETEGIETNGRATGAVRSIGLAVVAVAGALGALFAIAGRRTRRRVNELEGIEAQLEVEGDRARLEGELQRALELTTDEAAAYRIVDEALHAELGGTTAELLVADSSFAHVSRVAGAGCDESRSCQVGTPADCPAVRRGHTQRFASASSLDACPQLKARGGHGGAVCVPFAVGGSTVGVLHVEPSSKVTETRVEILEMIARKTGERVGVARAFAKSQDQALTDPLTGLLNRRSLEDKARTLADRGRGYTVIFTDLDHFKMLNDVHGHDAGDRALRLFSRCLREAARPTDAVGRYGGEEFVLVLADSDADTGAAEGVIDRLRAGLSRALDTGSVPRFTASFGVAHGAGDALADVIGRADAALLAAKRDGRDRTVSWTPEVALARSSSSDAASVQVA